MTCLCIFSSAQDKSKAQNEPQARLSCYRLPPGELRLSPDAVDWSTFQDVGPVEVDMYGVEHQRKQQFHKGLRIYGAEAIQHTVPGWVPQISYSGYFAKKLEVNLQPTYSHRQVLESVAAYVGSSQNVTTELVIIPGEPAILAWYVEEWEQDSNWIMLLDAKNGNILQAFNGVSSCGPGQGTGSGYAGQRCLDITYNSGAKAYELDAPNGFYQTHDGLGAGKISIHQPVRSTSTNFTNDDAVEAHYHAGTTFDFFSNQLNWDGHDNRGGKALVIFNFSPDFVAAWSPRHALMAIGEGGSLFDRIAGDLDAISHEIAHGVTSASSHLEYQCESGALNEAFSDIMATSASFYAGQGNWKIGEFSYTPTIQGDALRYMNDPTLDGKSRDHYSTRYTGTDDNGGVHINSGIANLAFYLLANGGYHPDVAGPYIEGIGVNNARDIFFTAFTYYLTSKSRFRDARYACELVAANYGSEILESVTNAWVAVGVGEGSYTPDYQVSALQVSPSTVEAGQETTLTFTIDNGGAQDGTSLWAGVFLSHNPFYDPNQDQLLDEVFMGVIRSGASRSKNLVVRMPQVANGPYYLHVVADHAEDIFERFEENNTATHALTIESGQSGSGAPTGVNATTNSATYQGSILVSWNAVSGAAGYWVSRSLSMGGAEVVTHVPAPVTEYLDSAVSAGQTYFYRVKAYNSQSTSPASSYAGGQAASSPFNPPTVTHPDSHFPTYVPGESQRLRITTNPIQANAPVYITRHNQNGWEFISQPLMGWVAGVWTHLHTNSNGVLDVTTTLDYGQQPCGNYDFERYAVGGVNQPWSLPGSFSITCIQAPTISRPDNNYPNYHLGDNAQLLVQTNPPQPYSPVYVWRKRNGVWESNGDPLVELVNGEAVEILTNSNGTLFRNMTIPLEGIYCGDYTEEQFSVGSPDNPKSPAITYTVHCN